MRSVVNFSHYIIFNPKNYINFNGETYECIIEYITVGEYKCTVGKDHFEFHVRDFQYGFTEHIFHYSMCPLSHTGEATFVFMTDPFADDLDNDDDIGDDERDE